MFHGVAWPAARLDAGKSILSFDEFGIDKRGAKASEVRLMSPLGGFRLAQRASIEQIPARMMDQ